MDTERVLLTGQGGSSLGQRPAPRTQVRLALRLAGGGLLIAAGAIHLDLYLTGYRSIPTIGWLFLFPVIAAFVLGRKARGGGRRHTLPGHAGRLSPVLVDRPVRIQGGPYHGRDRRRDS